MTPKEKAIELYSKYYNRIEHTLSEEYSLYEIDVLKQCALIAVDEIIEEYQKIFPNVNRRNYWDEVKEEINNLQ
jgi:hypothetical protein